MNLKEKFDQKNDDTKNIMPLGNDEIKSILKTQSETVFQDKNLTNNSNFVKKSLIDIALEFESKESNNNNLKNTENIKEETIQPKKNEDENEKINEKDKIVENDKEDEKNVRDNISKSTDELDKSLDKSLIEPELINQNNNEINTVSNELDTEEKYSENIPKKNTEIDIENDNSLNSGQIAENEKTLDPNTNIDETQQALDSVRDAVSQSINKSDNENDQSFKEVKELQDDTSDTILKDYNDFKNILSSLSNLSETAIYEAIKSKIIDVAYELAGYQIDQMPEKYEKKIKSLLKNMNCFEDKMKIEVNDQDYDALAKIENFFDTQAKSLFISNKDLTRGDIILNCDGMHYSEKSKKT